MKKLIYITAALLTCACTSSKDITVTSSLTVRMDMEPVVTAYAEAGEQTAGTDVYCLIYDGTGNLIAEGTKSVGVTAKDTLVFKGLDMEEYTILCASYSPSDYEIEHKDSLGLVTIRQNVYSVSEGHTPVLGVAYKTVNVDNTSEIDIALDPMCAYVRVSYVNADALAAEAADALGVLFRQNDKVDFKDGKVACSSDLAEGKYLEETIAIPSESGTEMSHSFFFLQSDAMEFNAYSFSGDEKIEEIGSGQFTFASGKSYQLIVNCLDKTVMMGSFPSAPQEPEEPGQDGETPQEPETTE